MNLEQMISRIEKESEELRKNGWNELCQYGGEDWEKIDICFARVFEDINDNTPGWFYSHAYGENPGSAVIPTKKMGTKVTPWHEWLLSPDSPFKDITKHLAIKDPEWIVKNAYVWENPADLDYKLMLCFLIATRQIWEMKEEIKNFYEFLKAGYSPNLAALMSQGVYKDGGVYFMASPRGHRLLSSNIFKYRIRWLTASPEPSSEVRSRKNAIWGSCETVFGDQKIPEEYDSLRRLVRVEIPKLAEDLMKGVKL